MDILILASGIASRLSTFTHDIIPKYLINIDNHTGLYNLITYWNKYANNIYLVINSKYNEITKNYIELLLPDYKSKIIIINYDTADGTAYTINHILNNDLKDKNIDNLLITWCDLYLTEAIYFNKLNSINKNTHNNIFVMTYGNKCRYNLTEDNEIVNVPESNGNIIGIYYIQNYKGFQLEDDCMGNDIVIYLDKISNGNIHDLKVSGVVDYGDEEKLLNIYNKITENEEIKSKDIIFNCRYFNNITLINNDKLLKKGIDDKGKQIIKYEKEWYNYINKTNSVFKNYIPKIYQYFEYGFLMEYKNNYIPLYEYLISIKNDNQLKNSILKNIMEKLNLLHNIRKETQTKITFFNDLKIEIYDKVISRREIVKPILDYFGKIEYVNDCKVLPFEVVLEKCKNIIINYYEAIEDYNYSIIVGDCNFSNILIDKNEPNNILFIDPRGYFGNSKVFGLPEYDYAKILYAISGYDNFNNSHFNITSINDNGNNNENNIKFNIEKIDYQEIILNKYFNKVHGAFMVINWLSLAEYNKNHLWKCIASYYHGLYLGTFL